MNIKKLKEDQIRPNRVSKTNWWKTYCQLVLVEFRNSGYVLYNIVSDKVITIKRVARFLEKTEDWDENRDNITFLSNVTEINIDKKSKVSLI